jgi:nucleotide-binding universal stress UspA family protein
MKVKRILVPLDGSETSLHSLKYAIDLAKQCNASVMGLHVLADMSLFTAAHAIVVREDKWPSHVKDLMREARSLADKNNTSYEQMVIGGKSAGYDILTFAQSKANAIDLIIMGRRGRSLPKEVFFGSTTNFVIHKSRIPVLVTR